jgi:N-methylhydantoinase A/oxoprolinase/acetone carboxylase beta subunit
VGALHQGFPRRASVTVEVGGVRTNFRMPDVFSIGLGGGSLVHRAGDAIRVGPRSVGHRLVREALIFGGATLTASDVAVAAGLAELGNPAEVASLDRTLVEDTMSAVASMLDLAAERMRLSPEPLPVITVGGGSILVGDAIGAAEVVKPPHFAVANAVGAAIAQVSGEVDRIYALGEASWAEALDDAKAQAIGCAVAAGALRESVEIVDVEDVPLAYLPGNATRIRVKAVGDLRV